MQNKPSWKILVISFVFLIVVSCVAPCAAIDDDLSDNAYDTFPSENITADNTPFPYHKCQ